MPGRQVKFRFDDLAKAAGKSQRRGGVQVTLDDVRKNNAIWEVHMRLALDEDNGALQSHRGWVFQNLSYLVGKDGEPIDNAGFETTRQTPNEVGVAYLFDVPDGIEGLTLGLRNAGRDCRVAGGVRAQGHRAAVDRRATSRERDIARSCSLSSFRSAFSAIGFVALAGDAAPAGVRRTFRSGPARPARTAR